VTASPDQVTLLTLSPVIVIGAVFVCTSVISTPPEPTILQSAGTADEATV
jgi:hypothetical protein